MYGKNLMDIVIKPIYQILFEDVLKFFYFFQILSLALWMIQDYYVYGTTICLMLGISVYR